MRKAFYIVICAVLLLSGALMTTSCKSQFEALLESADVEAKYKAAFELFEKERYSKASQMFESVSLATNGTAQDDTVQFYIGYCNYRFGDYPTAESNLEHFISVFPLSPFAEQAKFLHLDCLYRGTYRYELDQIPTKKAIVAMKGFLIDNPNSEYVPEINKMLDDLNGRLELKAYKSAYLYYHMEDYLASHYALKNVLKENADNRYREEILFYIAMSSYKYASLSIQSKQRERYLVFVDDYLNMVSEYPDSHFTKELVPYYEKTQKILKKTE